MRVIYTASEICNAYKVIPKEESSVLRQRFIETFCHTNTNYYECYISGLSGYFLWDCISYEYKEISIYDIKYDPPFEGKVFIFGDYYTLGDEMEVLGRDHVIELDFEVFSDNANRFPQDSYIFDTNFQMALVMSHEGFNNIDKDFWLYTPK